MAVYTDTLWYELHCEIGRFMRDNGFTSDKCHIVVSGNETPVVDNMPIITFEWDENSGGDLADGGQTINRKKSCNSVIFISVYNGDAEAEGMLLGLDTYNTTNKIQKALYDWMCTEDKVNYPLSNYVSSAPFRAKNTKAQILGKTYTGVAYFITFNYNINNGE